MKPPLPGDPNHHRQRKHWEGVTCVADEVRKPGVHPSVAFEHDPANAIVVPPDLVPSHPLILKTRRLLNRGKRDATGRVLAGPGGLHVHASRAVHERALRILEVLVRALEGRGLAVVAGNVTILDETLAFGIEEGTKNEPHRTTFTEQKLIDRGAGWQVPKFDHVPSGTLTLVITNVKGVRQRWAETRSRPLEELLNRFVIGLVRAALGLKRQREEAERREVERQAAEKAREEEAARLAAAALRWREEQGRIDRFMRIGDMWSRNVRLRELVAAVKGATGEVEAESELGLWLSWAEEYAKRSDPLSRLRERSGRSLVLYYYGYDHGRVNEDGFREPEIHSYSNEKPKAGVELTDRPPRVTAYESALKLELPEDLVLPYEWPQESTDYWRVFRVPAEVLNRFVREAPAS